MMNFRSVAVNTATAFAVTLPFSLLACSESNPTNFDEPVAYSEPAPESSSALESSSSAEESVSLAQESSSSNEDLSELPSILCTAENEGQIDSIKIRSGMYGSIHEFFRCEQGSWVKRDPWVRCDSKDVQEGDACLYTCIGGGAMPYTDIYVYTGDGVWDLYDGENGLAIGKFTVRTGDERKTVFYKRAYMVGWLEIDEVQYSCFSKFAKQDTCVLETDEGKNYYQKALVDFYASPVWSQIDFDPELGFCSFFDYQKYGEKKGKFYYCSQQLKILLYESERLNPKWVETELLPRQYTDSRKEGLTDEEYDVLDLPKDASVGDRVGGLLEVCFYRQKLDDVGLDSVLDFCISQNYYRYGEDGSWKLDVHYRYEEDYEGVWGSWLLQTEEEIAEEEKNNRCTSENEGAEIAVLPRVNIIPLKMTLNFTYTNSDRFALPGAVYQCVGGKKVFKDFAFVRY